MSTPGIGRLLRSPWVRSLAAQRGNVSRFLRISAMGRDREHVKVSMKTWWFGNTTFFVDVGGALTFAGSLNKQVNKADLAGVLSFSGALSLVRVILLSLSGSLSFDGALVKRIDKSLGGSLSFVGDIIKEIRKAGLGGTLTFAGNLLASLIARRDVGGSVSFIGNLIATRIPGAGSTLRNLWKWWSGGM